MHKSHHTDVLEALDTKLQGLIERKRQVGMLTLIEQNEQLRVRSFGKQSLGGAAMQADTIVRIASISKPIVSAGALLLLEEGKFRLDDPVETWLPELANRRVLKTPNADLDDTVPAKRSIMVGDLFNSCMGFGMLMSNDPLPILAEAQRLELGVGIPAPASYPPSDEWMARLDSLPLIYQPGERWTYQSSYAVLGILIERVSGMALGAFLEERLFRPLGMHDTHFSLPAEKATRLSECYRFDSQEGRNEIFDPALGGQWNSPPRFQSGADGLLSTALDLHTFAKMLLQKGVFGQKRILQEQSVLAMTRPQISPEQARTTGGFLEAQQSWGFGLAVQESRYGWDGGLGCSWANDSATQTIAIFLSQNLWSEADSLDPIQDFWQAVQDWSGKGQTR
jgi:CubicO group peptidase (beta-lactamase class C family)